MVVVFDTARLGERLVPFSCIVFNVLGILDLAEREEGEAEGTRAKRFGVVGADTRNESFSVPFDLLFAKVIRGISPSISSISLLVSSH